MFDGTLPDIDPVAARPGEDGNRATSGCGLERLRAGLIILVSLFGFTGMPALAPDFAGSGVEVAVELPLTGDEAEYGVGVMEGVDLAIEEANATGAGPRINLKRYDDQANDDRSKQFANRIVESPAVAVLGPAFSKNSFAAGPIYAAGSIASFATTCMADLITECHDIPGHLQKQRPGRYAGLLSGTRAQQEDRRRRRGR